MLIRLNINMNGVETFAEALRTSEIVFERKGVVAERVYAFIHLAFKLLQVGSVFTEYRRLQKSGRLSATAIY